MRSIKLFLVLLFITFPLSNINAGSIIIQESDTQDPQISGVFDLRDRESFIQITNTDSENQTIHIQIFDVSNNCGENDFFDSYTPNDTHVYNLRDISTNDGNPSGVVLPSDSYGIFVATNVGFNPILMGNMRIINNSGYEYRTNLLGIGLQAGGTNPPNNTVSFNYNIENGVILSDLYGFETWDAGSEEIKIADILNAWINLDVDIYDSNEVPFSCRNVIFACVDQDNPLLEALLELVNDGENANTGNGSGSVASFEYGINEAIPSSKDAPLLCPNNNISEGIVNFTLLDYLNDGLFMFFVGLNNGNGRGSFESYWHSQL